MIRQSFIAALGLCGAVLFAVLVTGVLSAAWVWFVVAVIYGGAR